MKSLDSSLQRLLRAASRGQPPAPGSLSAAMQGRVLAHWLAAPPLEAPSLLLVQFRRAAIGAVGVMLLSVAWGCFSGSGEAAGVKGLAAYELNLQFPP